MPKWPRLFGTQILVGRAKNMVDFTAIFNIPAPQTNFKKIFFLRRHAALCGYTRLRGTKGYWQM
jgi:hypothetical protein